MRRALLAMILVGLALLVATHLHGYGNLLDHRSIGHGYPTANAGVFIDMPGGHWLGFEYRPAPGFFWDVS